MDILDIHGVDTGEGASLEFLYTRDMFLACNIICNYFSEVHTIYHQQSILENNTSCPPCAIP